MVLVAALHIKRTSVIQGRMKGEVVSHRQPAPFVLECLPLYLSLVVALNR